MIKKRYIAAAIVCAALLLSICAFVLPAMRQPKSDLLLETLDVGGQSYAFYLASSKDKLTLGEPQASSDSRILRDRTQKVYPIYRAGTPAGSLTFTLDKTETGSIFYLETDAPLGTQVLIRPPAAQDMTVRPISQWDTELSEPLALSGKGATFGQDTALYLEGGMSLYVSRPAVLTGLGHTVYVRERPERGVSVTFPAQEPLVSIPLGSETGSSAAVWGVLTPGPLMNWETAAAASGARLLDSDAETSYTLREDGVYLAMPDSYRPYLENLSDGQTHIYRTSAAWLIGPATLQPPGDMFRTLGASIVYTYIDAVNDEGFIPTYPSSTWLSGDYGIGANFYDTRFNIDTMMRLYNARTVWDEPALEKTLHPMIAHYLRHREGNAFEVRGLTFVPDYADAQGMQNGAASSLNHYLAEGLFLLRAGDAFENETYWEAGLAVLQAIEESHSWWIRENGDLWYAIRPDGEMEKDDYVSVTYNDLIDACRLLVKFDMWCDYPGIQRLLDSKEQWMAAQGHSHLILSHEPFTYNT